jgi:small subunit ribosomal protein S1
MDGVKVGDRVQGTVKNLTDFGAFIDLDGMDGLLHITDMTWGRLGHPSELVKVGQQLEVQVLDINKEKERVSLGLKQTQKNPWDQIEERFPAGQKVKGKITNLVPYGAFVELEEGVEGLIHVSELSWTKRIMRPSDILTVGQEVEAVVLGVNKEEQKISLGLRQLEPNPWDEIEHKFTIGSRVKGKIRNMTAYGAFVELDEGIDGMIHVSDLSWTRKINHPSEVFKKGDEVEAEVIDIDKTNQRISLGIKQLSEDPWKNIDQKYKIGDLVKGKVTKLASFGAFVQLADDIDGLVHISQLSEDHVAKVKDVLKVGQEVEARVIKVDKVERRIGLSIKAANYSEEELRKEAETFDTLKPGEDMVGLEKAFAAAEQEEYRPSESKKTAKEPKEAKAPKESKRESKKDSKKK